MMKHKYNLKDRIKKYDDAIEYISGYIDCNSIVKCYCNRCNNYFERKWYNLARKNTEYCCPICQTKLGLKKAKANHNSYIEPIEDREAKFIDRLQKKFPSLEYVSGYEGSDMPILLKCKICGNTFQRCANMVRGKKQYRCNNCYKQNKLIEVKIKEQDNYLNEKKREETKEINLLYKRLIKDTILIKHCLLCGIDITDGSKKIYCSICKKHMKNKNRSDTKIPLKRLYERDKGICYLCGNKCDLEDYVYKGNVFIAGNYYPSVEHIIPRAKGGTDTWDNVKLAHRICNSLKGINPPLGAI